MVSLLLLLLLLLFFFLYSCALKFQFCDFFVVKVMIDCVVRFGALNCRDGENAEYIEEALRSVGCPHPLRSYHVRDLDTEVIFPVIQWLTLRVRPTQEASGNEVL